MAKLENPLSLSIPNILDHIKTASRKKTASPFGRILVLGAENKSKLGAWFDECPQWQRAQIKSQNREWNQFSSNNGPVWVICRKKLKMPPSHSGRLEESDYTWFREQVGLALTTAKAMSIGNLEIEFHDTTAEQELGALVGLGLASYSYKSAIEKKALDGFPQVTITQSQFVDKDLLRQGFSRSQGVNTARHLVNTPPNFANPTTVKNFVLSKFSKLKNVKVEVWEQKRLEQEGMGLLVGVGQGSPNPPCMIRIQYRPVGKNQKPIAFVGKGITFDTGGLDIKPSSGMRMMKKDMGGASAVIGLATWAIESKFDQPLDFYLALAENSVDGHSMRPSDVLTARNGMKVEIHNTDAEGRLVLADVLDVAVTQTGKDEPQAVINIATLTGACRVALGVEIGGLFSNSDELADAINLSGQRAGDLNWRLPLYSRYTGSFTTPFGDIVNATDGMGGAITAALFLEKFIRNKPWVHLDVYAWNDKPTGSLSFAGGNGQTVQCLIDWLTSRSS